MKFPAFCNLLIFLIVLPAVSAQAPIQLPEVVGRGEIRARSVQLTGADAALLRDARRLVRLHGGLQESSSRPDFVLRLELAGASGVEIAILSGGQLLWGDRFNGTGRQDSLMLAMDRAVERMLGIPGFFRSQIAFVSERTGHPEIYTSDMLFSDSRQLTSDRSEALSPDFHPDGHTLLYTSYHGTGFPDIYRIDLRSGRRSVFAAFRGTNSGARFSPDGNSVAMVLSASGNAEIFISDANGGNLRRITRTPSLESGPSWSADGRRLLLTSDQMGRPQIYTTDTGGRVLSRVRTDISRNCSEPTWNPRDANQIAFTAAMGREFEVAVFDFNEGRSRVISNGPGDAVHPRWLRDGRHLIYTERTARSARLMILDTVTGTSAPLSPGEFPMARQATWYYRR